MNDYHAAWLEQISQKEMYYLYVFLVVAVIYLWYQWLRGAVKWAVRGFLAVIVVALGAGIWFLIGI